MLVEEVSNVDRAANKRRFLLVKRDDGDSMTTKLIPNGDGTFKKVVVTKDESGAAAAEGETNTAGAGAAGEAAADTDTEKKFPPGAKAPPFGKKPGSGGGSKDEDEDDEDDDKSKKPWEKGAARKQAAAALTDCVSKLIGAAEALATDPDVDTTKVQGEIGTAVAELNKALVGVAQPITKVGRRMAKDRLARFDKALAELSGILKEVMDAPEEEEAEKGEAPPAKAAEKSFDNPGEAGANGTTDKTDADLMRQISNLKEVNKRQEREISVLRKSNVAPPNSAKPEKEPARTKTQKSDEDVEWPLDMNRPITRETTKKEFSFYDD